MLEKNVGKGIRWRWLIGMLAVLLALLSGCAKDNNPVKTPDTSDQAPVGDGDEKTRYYPEQTDYQGYTYRIYVQSEEQYFAYTEDNAGDAVNIALYDRAEKMKNHFHIDLKVVGDVKLNDTVTTYVSSNTDFADVVMPVAATAISGGVPAGHYLDISGINGLHLDASYWDQRIQQEYNINGRFYALEGDFSVVDELRTYVMLYNADLYNTYEYQEKYGSPYEIIHSGKWTYDLFLEMIKGASIDSTGNGMDQNDTWAFLSESAVPYAFFLGTGMKTARSEEGTVVLPFDDNYEPYYNVFEKIMKGMIKNPDMLMADSSNGVLADTSDVPDWGGVEKIFREGRALFRSTTLTGATNLRDMKARFGILPVPKYTEDQDGYYSWTSSYSHLPMMFPSTAREHIDTTAALSEALCYFSRYMPEGTLSLYESFFDRMTYSRLCLTPDDRTMLELIFASKTYDLDSAATFTNISHRMGTVLKSGKMDTLSSELKQLKDNSVERVSDYLTKLAQNSR